MRKEVRQRFPYTDAIWSRPTTESDWLDQRRTDVTATDAAALFGVSPYATPFELFNVKAGRLEVEFEETERMRWGKRLQDAIARGICEDNGWKIINADPFLYVRSRRFPGMGASPDYIVLCPTRGVGMLEIKNVDLFIARDGWDDDEAPVHIEFQLQHQLECGELAWGAIGGLVGGNKARVIIRERDEEVGTEIGQRVLDLWRRVRDDDQFQPDFLKDHSVLKRLYRDADVGKVIDFTGVDLAGDDDERGVLAMRLSVLCEAERSAASREKSAKEDRQIAQSEILTLIEDAESVVGIPGFKLRAATQHREARVQEVKASSYRDLRISPIKPKATSKPPPAEAPADTEQAA